MIIGTGLAAINGGLFGGNGVGGIFGGNHNVIADDKIDALQNELIKEKSERYTDRAVCDLKSLMYDKLDAMKDSVNVRFADVNSALCAQNVWNATNTSTINCLTNQLNQISALLTYGVASDKVISSSSSSSTT